MDKSEYLYAGGRKAYLDRNREKLRLQERIRYAKNREESAKKKRVWRANNKKHFNAWQRERYRSHLDYFHKRSRLYHRANRDLRNLATRKYYRKHRDVLLEKNRIRSKCPIVKSRRSAKLQLRRKTDINFRIETDCRSVIRASIKLAIKRHGQQIIKCRKSMELLGCSIENLKIYLESKFESGMSWDNWSRDGWHIDHIIPCAIFDLTKPEHQKRCFHFSNLQPLWAMDNFRKHSKVVDNQFRLL